MNSELSYHMTPKPLTIFLILLGFPAALLMVGIVFAMVITPIYKFNQVAGHSMEPSYPQGSYLYSMRMKSGWPKLERGQVVIHERDLNGRPGELIQRIVGLPGESIMIKGGLAWINGQALAEDYLADGIETVAGQFLSEGQAKEIPEGMYVVLGDNRPYSSDSRAWGFVEEQNISGVVKGCYWGCGH